MLDLEHGSATSIGDFFSGSIVLGISRVHANSDDIPWENPQKSIIIRVFRPSVRIMMDLCGLSIGMSSEFTLTLEIPIQCTR